MDGGARDASITRIGDEIQSNNKGLSLLALGKLTPAEMAAVDSKIDTSKMHLPPAFHISGQSMVELPADKSTGNTASVRPAIVFENNENNKGDGVKSSYNTNVPITRIENHLPEQMKSSDDLFSDFEKADRAVCDVVSRIAQEAIDHPFKAASEAVLGVAAGAISAEIIGAVAGAVVSVSAAEMIGSVAGTVIGAMYTGTQLHRDATFASRRLSLDTTAYTGIASVHFVQARHRESENAYKTALQIRASSMGYGHPATARIATKYANTFQSISI